MKWIGKAMADPFKYLDTDLDLLSSTNLSTLAAALGARGVRALDVVELTTGGWWARFESEEQFEAPEPNIAAMLDAIEKLDEPLRAVWFQCEKREFNAGYDCGLEPWGFQQGLSPELLARMAAARASFHVTLYPHRPPRGGPDDAIRK